MLLRVVTTGLVFGLLSAAPPGRADEAPPFAEVRAIFAAKCLACHGNDAENLKGDYDLRSREAALKGGESGEPAIVPASRRRARCIGP